MLSWYYFTEKKYISIRYFLAHFKCELDKLNFLRNEHAYLFLIRFKPQG